MKNRINEDFIRAALVRAIKTAAQVMLSMLSANVAITDFDWPQILAISATSFIYSILTSIVFGIPEATYQGSLSFEKVGENEEASVQPVLKIDIPGDDLLDKKQINIKVEKEN